MKKEKILDISCANCPLNDGVVYTSFPPKFKCTATNEWHFGEHRCGRVKIFYDETMINESDLTKVTPLNYNIIDETPLASSGDSRYQIYGGYLENEALINLIRDVDIG